jgi:magnesium-transporting ATPase (P-type)
VLNHFTGCTVDTQPPNEFIYKFEGNLKLQDGNIVPLNPDNLLLKGSSLQNTEYIYGVAVYTGHETKIMQNCVGSRLKKSDVQKKMEKYILITILLQFCICVAAGIISATWANLTG